MTSETISFRASDDALADAILTLSRERGQDKTICPSEAARKLAGSNPDIWGAMMSQVRKVAISLAREGRVVIYRKGRAIAPDDLKGVYRIGLPRAD